eukprot:scaffold733_cov267-Pinguiococcus_pyrenoidosus.AAC.58
MEGCEALSDLCMDLYGFGSLYALSPNSSFVLLARTTSPAGSLERSSALRGADHSTPSSLGCCRLHRTSRGCNC